jgi:uncharacterized protein YcgI (DUF1989 family)
VADEKHTIVLSHVIAPKSAFAWTCRRGSLIRITDLEGRQVGDLALLALENPRERISISWTRTRNLRDTAAYVPPLGLHVGDRIYSTGYRVMATVIEDTCEPKGVHDLFGRMCNRGMYELYGVEPQPGCFELLQSVLSPHGIAPEEIPDPLGVFMHTVPHPDTRVMEIREPVSRAGDSLTLRAEMDLLAAMSTCPMDVIAPTNGWRITPMRIEVLEPEAAS